MIGEFSATSVISLKFPLQCNTRSQPELKEVYAQEQSEPQEQLEPQLHLSQLQSIFLM